MTTPDMKLKCVDGKYELTTTADGRKVSWDSIPAQPIDVVCEPFSIQAWIAEHPSGEKMAMYRDPAIEPPTEAEWQAHFERKRALEQLEKQSVENGEWQEVDVTIVGEDGKPLGD